MSRQKFKTRKAFPRPAEIDLCWQTTGRWTHTVGLQHPERVNTAFGSPSKGRKLSQSHCPALRFVLLNSFVIK